MVYEVEITREEKEFDYVSKMGWYNTMPKPFKKITQKEFLDVFAREIPKAIEFRQTNLGGNTNIYWFNNYALAINYKENEKVFYRIGCNQMFLVKDEEDGYVTYKCEKCGISRKYACGD